MSLGRSVLSRDDGDSRRPRHSWDTNARHPCSRQCSMECTHRASSWNIVAHSRLHKQLMTVNDNYEGRAKSFEPEHIRLQFFSQSIISVKRVNSSPTPMSLLRIWHHRNLWRHKALNGNDSKRQRKSLESFIIVNSGHHNNQIIDFKTK